MKTQPPELKYKDYFEEIVPLTMAPGEKLAHVYTVEIKRAMYSKETFTVFQKYEARVHKEENKTRESYENFLC